MDRQTQDLKPYFCFGHLADCIKSYVKVKLWYRKLEKIDHKDNIDEIAFYLQRKTEISISRQRDRSVGRVNVG